MTLSFPTLRALQAVITGDSAPGNDGESVAPYLTGREIDALLRSVDGLDLVNVGVTTSRGDFVRAVIEAEPNRALLSPLISAALHPGRFVRDPKYTQREAVDYLNTYLQHDGYLVALAGSRVSIGEIDDHHVLRLPGSGPASLETTMQNVRRRLDQATARSTGGDHEGAVTLARSALEMLLEDLNHRLPGAYEDAKGDLLVLFKHVRRRMQMDPQQQDVEAILHVLRGITSIVQGLSQVRNRMSDAHPTKFRVRRHHAMLAVNSVSTLASFIADSLAFQRSTLRDGEP